MAGGFHVTSPECQTYQDPVLRLIVTTFPLFLTKQIIPKKMSPVYFSSALVISRTSYLPSALKSILSSAFEVYSLKFNFISNHPDAELCFAVVCKKASMQLFVDI